MRAGLNGSDPSDVRVRLSAGSVFGLLFIGYVVAVGLFLAFAWHPQDRPAQAVEEDASHE
jgi:hypothetical protein